MRAAAIPDVTLPVLPSLSVQSANSFTKKPTEPEIVGEVCNT